MNEQELLKRIERLENLLRRPTRPHRIQPVKHKLIRTDPTNINASDLEDGEMALVKDESNSKWYVMARIEGEIKKAELS